MGKLWRAIKFGIRNFREKIELFFCVSSSLVISIHWFSFFSGLGLSSIGDYWNVTKLIMSQIDGVVCFTHWHSFRMNDGKFNMFFSAFPFTFTFPYVLHSLDNDGLYSKLLHKSHGRRSERGESLEHFLFDLKL